MQLFFGPQKKFDWSFFDTIFPLTTTKATSPPGCEKSIQNCKAPGEKFTECQDTQCNLRLLPKFEIFDPNFKQPKNRQDSSAFDDLFLNEEIDVYQVVFRILFMSR